MYFSAYYWHVFIRLQWINSGMLTDSDLLLHRVTRYHELQLSQTSHCIYNRWKISQDFLKILKQMFSYELLHRYWQKREAWTNSRIERFKTITRKQSVNEFVRVYSVWCSIHSSCIKDALSDPNPLNFQSFIANP